MTNLPPSQWPMTIIDNETGEQRVVSRQRAQQLLNPEVLRRAQLKFNKTEKRKQYLREYFKKNPEKKKH